MVEKDNDYESGHGGGTEETRVAKSPLIYSTPAFR